MWLGTLFKLSAMLRIFSLDMPLEVAQCLMITTVFYFYSFLFRLGKMFVGNHMRCQHLVRSLFNMIFNFLFIGIQLGVSNFRMNFMSVCSYFTGGNWINCPHCCSLKKKSICTGKQSFILFTLFFSHQSNRLNSYFVSLVFAAH